MAAGIQPSILDAMEEYELRQETVYLIAKRHGITPSALTARAKRLGLPLRQRGRWAAAEPCPRDRIIIQLSDELTYEDVGTRFGVSKQRVHQILRRWVHWRTDTSVDPNKS